jgi:hypothetical protein
MNYCSILGAFSAGDILYSSSIIELKSRLLLVRRPQWCVEKMKFQDRLFR